MKIVRYPDTNPLEGDFNCITVGNFDGVHLGHQSLIKRIVDKARQMQGQSVIVSMNPLPQQYFMGKTEFEVITSFKQKCRILAQMNIDVFCVLNFNRRLASMGADEFFNSILLGGLRAKYLVIGDDFKFGANREGDEKLLSRLCVKNQIELITMDSLMINERRVSSSLIRKYLADSDFVSAKSMMGRDYVVQGRVIHGKKLGRELGFPTINISLKSNTCPLHGIYVVKIKIEHKWYQAVASVGVNPTVIEQIKILEVFVIDFNREVYGKTVEVLIEKQSKKITLRLNITEINENRINKISTIVEENKGTVPLDFLVYDLAEEIKLNLHSRSIKVNVDNTFLKVLENEEIKFRIN
ncbi:MAG: riboflavin biosynthesis protein RibF [Proteobacteria bacterium]|nr:riboflavin biosynthesis protein RibF [Pseudomonadota bacterium]